MDIVTISCASWDDAHAYRRWMWDVALIDTHLGLPSMSRGLPCFYFFRSDV